MSESNRGPENIGDILGRLFMARGWGRKNDRMRLETAWTEAASEFVKDTRLMGMKRGVMEIEVRNAVLIQELTQYHKRGLLGRLRKSLPGVTLTDIKFRAGVW